MKLRQLLVTLTLLAFGPLAHAGFVQVATGTVSGGAGTVTMTGVNAADTLILFAGAASGSASNVGSPPAGYTAANVPSAYVNAGLSTDAVIYYNQSPSSGSNTVTISFSAGGGGPMVLVEWSGMSPGALDVHPAASNVTNGSTAGSNSIASGTLSQANEVIFAVLLENSSGAGSANVGLTNPPTGFVSVAVSQDSSGSTAWGVAYKVVSATTTQTASWTWTDTATIASQATLASFKLPSVTPTTTGASVGLQFP